MKLAKTLTLIAAATLIGAGTFSTSAIVSADKATEAAISAKKSEGDTLAKQLAAAQMKLSDIDNQLSDKTVAIQDAQKKISATQATITEYSAKIAKQAEEIAARKDTLKKQLESLQKELGDSVTGNVYFEFLLKSKDLSDLISRGVTVSKLNDANKEALDDVNAAKAKMDDLKAAQEAKKTELTDTKTKLEADKAKLVTLKADSAKAAQALAKKIADNKDAVAALEKKQSEAAAAALKAVQAAAAAKAAATKTVTTTTTTVSTGQANVNTPSTPSTPTVVGGGSSALAGIAVKYLGIPYVYGGTTPSGFDCSGFVQYVARQAGISLPRVSQSQSLVGTVIPVSQMQAGDLVFWGGRGSAHHVGIAISNSSYVHAPHTGDVVKIASTQWYMPSFAVRL
ncbi:NlpC/P60 family protein [Lacticaseibacillus absianus]|uniref:C40 family peptidase n=1 Tax=Lacticaseibacillus absianus TaxID=2729623 RepID=UPI0015C7EFB7|nr:C40 family peptidase [Lacticaseibacillus absianus]